MTLELLLQKYSRIRKEMEKVRKLEMGLNDVLDLSKKSIEKRIHQEFERHVRTVNRKLPKKRRVTEWRISYLGHLRRAFIRIISLGGKLY